MYKLILVIFLTVASCGTSKNSSKTSSVNETEGATQIQEGNITLALGETQKVGDIQVQFKEVLEDSRCPTGVTCIWQGSVKLLVETSEDGLTVDQNEIIFGKLKTGETKNHSFYKSGNTTITATAIHPYPTKEIGPADLDYKLVLKIDLK